MPAERLAGSLMRVALEETKRGTFGWRMKERVKKYGLVEAFQRLKEGKLSGTEWKKMVATALENYENNLSRNELENAVKVGEVLKRGEGEKGAKLYLSLGAKISSFLFRLRSGDLELSIETGRLRGVAREERICPLCEEGEVEDTAHFCLWCPALAAERGLMFAAVEAVVEPWKGQFSRWVEGLGKTVTFKGETADTVLLRHLLGEPMEGMPREAQSAALDQIGRGLRSMWVKRCRLVPHERPHSAQSFTSKTVATQGGVALSQPQSSPRVHAQYVRKTSTQ